MAALSILEPSRTMPEKVEMTDKTLLSVELMTEVQLDLNTPQAALSK